MAFKNYYDILNVKQNASSDEIKKAFRKLSIKFHPDKNDGDEFLAEMFKNINEANEVLSNVEKRRDFDSKLNANNSYSNNNHKNPKDDYKTESELAEKYKTFAVNQKAFYEQQKIVTNKQRQYNEALNAPKPKYISFLTIIFLCIVTLLIWIMFKPKNENSTNTKEQSSKINETQISHNIWTTKEMAEIYKEPDIESEVLGHAQRSQSFEAIEETKYFIKISYENSNQIETGYLRKKQLTQN